MSKSSGRPAHESGKQKTDIRFKMSAQPLAGETASLIEKETLIKENIE
jgi:hypothetical protein